MIVARITRASIGRALDLGLSAEAIRQYLDCHAHPRAKATGIPVPDNVRDQIYLWEQVSEGVVVAMDLVSGARATRFT